MSYFESVGWQKDFTNLLKSIVLISQKLEDLTTEVRLLRKAYEVDTKQEKTTD